MRSTGALVANFSQVDDDSILTYLAHEFPTFLEVAGKPGTRVNTLWLQFKNIVSHCMNNFIPLRLTRPRKNNPWITREIIHAKRKVKRLRKSFKKNKASSPNAPNLRRAIANFKSKIKEAK